MINLGKAISISIALSAAITSSTALAAPAIVTPVITAKPSASGGHLCVVLNLSGKTLTIRQQIINPWTGEILTSSISPTAPGGSTILETVNAPSVIGQSYCVVTGISKNHARVTHCALNLADTACESTVTVP